MEIAILTIYDGLRRGRICDFHPFFKWRREFKSKGVRFRFFRDHQKKAIKDFETVFIDHRYYRNMMWLHEKYTSADFLIDFMNRLKNNGNRVILFDHGDRPNSEQWHLIEHCDLFIKQQLLKDRKLYTQDRGFKNKIEFTEAFQLSKEQRRKNRENARKYACCPEDQFHKIRLGWSRGMYDYREFPLSRLKIDTSRLMNRLYKLPCFTTDFDSRTIDSSFRGDTKKGDENYAWQRNQVIKYLEKDESYIFKTGKIIPKKEYWKELRRSKTCISPFGHGEICYRDFEAIVAGCVLIKPNMDHIESYPDIYKKNETYVDLQWDLSDMEEKVEEVINNYEEYKEMVIHAQRLYKSQISSFDNFYNKFKYLFKH